jgi:hypothetical protein
MKGVYLGKGNSVLVDIVTKYDSSVECNFHLV